MGTRTLGLTIAFVLLAACSDDKRRSSSDDDDDGAGGGSAINCNDACDNVTFCCPAISDSDCMQGCAVMTSSQCLACQQDTSCANFVPCLIAHCGVDPSACP